MKFLQNLKAKIVHAYLSHYNKEISKLVVKGSRTFAPVKGRVLIQSETDYTSIPGYPKDPKSCDNLWKEFKKANPCLSCKILSEFKKDGGQMFMTRRTPDETLTKTIYLNYCPTCGEKLEKCQAS